MADYTANPMVGCGIVLTHIPIGLGGGKVS